MIDGEASQDSEVEDLVNDYEQFLKRRQEQTEAEHVKDKEDMMEIDTDKIPIDKQPDFDYQLEKLEKRAMFDEWRGDLDLCQRSIALLSKFKQETGSASASLCEQLRIVLEPQLSQQL